VEVAGHLVVDVEQVTCVEAELGLAECAVAGEGLHAHFELCDRVVEQEGHVDALVHAREFRTRVEQFGLVAAFLAVPVLVALVRVRLHEVRRLDVDPLENS